MIFLKLFSKINSIPVISVLINSQHCYHQFEIISAWGVKKGSKLDYNNYQPISLLPNIEKILEKRV